MLKNEHFLALGGGDGKYFCNFCKNLQILRVLALFLTGVWGKSGIFREIGNFPEIRNLKMRFLISGIFPDCGALGLFRVSEILRFLWRC